MRKALLLTAMMAAMGGAAFAAQASQDGAPDKIGVEHSNQDGASHEDARHLNAPRDDRSDESRERSRGERRQAHEDDEDDDRD